MHISEKKLKDILLSSGIIQDQVFESARQEAVRMNQQVTDILIGRRAISEDYLLELLEVAFDIPVVDLRKVVIDEATRELLNESYAKTHRVIVFNYDTALKTVHLAMQDPLDMDTISHIHAQLKATVLPYFTSAASLHYGLKQYKKQVVSGFTRVIEENVKKFFSEGGETDIAKLAEAIPIVTILDNLFEQALTMNASDIHFEPFANSLIVRYRVDGILQESVNVHKSMEPILVARIKILANLRIDEHATPQDGRFKTESPDGGMLDVRVNVMPVMHGERVALRLLKSSAHPFSLEELGMSDEVVNSVSKTTHLPHGMVLVTGPTGHGKTTTLYSILHILNTPLVNIMTIEDPIEYEVDRINQTQVNPKSGVTFAAGLRSHLRQNPDIIMVGEIRDNETAEIAVHAALTGHLVLSTLHTNDAPSALPRLLDMGAPAFLLVSTVNSVIAERLVRKICNSCIESYKTSDDMKKLIAMHTKRKKSIVPTSLYRGKGCEVCNFTGFQGQTGVFEILEVTQSIKNLILKLAPVQEIRAKALVEGMVPMFEDGMSKVQKGITTIEEILRVVSE